eukprot:5691833-Prymnesium_polylepis.1
MWHSWSNRITPCLVRRARLSSGAHSTTASSPRDLADHAETTAVLSLMRRTGRSRRLLAGARRER